MTPSIELYPHNRQPIFLEKLFCSVARFVSRFSFRNSKENTTELGLPNTVNPKSTDESSAKTPTEPHSKIYGTCNNMTVKIIPLPTTSPSLTGQLGIIQQRVDNQNVINRLAFSSTRSTNLKSNSLPTVKQEHNERLRDPNYRVNIALRSWYNSRNL